MGEESNLEAECFHQAAPTEGVTAGPACARARFCCWPRCVRVCREPSALRELSAGLTAQDTGLSSAACLGEREELPLVF